MKDYIVDASVIAKWLLPEPDHEGARVLIDAPCSLRAPDLIMPEVASIVLKRIMRHELTFEEGSELLQLFQDEFIGARVRIIPSRLLAERALQIARTEGRGIYDSLYVALAVQAQCRLITADEKLVNGIRNKVLKQH